MFLKSVKFWVKSPLKLLLILSFSHISSIPSHTERAQPTFLIAPVQLIFPRDIIRLLIHIVSHGALQSTPCG